MTITLMFVTIKENRINPIFILITSLISLLPDLVKPLFGIIIGISKNKKDVIIV